MRRAILALALVALGPLAAWTAPVARSKATRPNFTGTWKLRIDRSVMGDLPGQPLARTDSIEHREPHVHHVLYLTNLASQDTADYVYATDSTETKNQAAGQQIRSRANWEGRALHLFSKTKLALVLEMTLDERWRLAPGGDSLVMIRRVDSPIGKVTQRLVFVRVRT